MSDWTGCIPFVAAIIERKTAGGELELLVQTRWNTKHPSIYNGTIEFAAGALDIPYENVYDAITREVKEETGYTVKNFIEPDQTEPVKLQGNGGAHGFRPFCCTQQLFEGSPWVGFIFRCEVQPGEPKGQAGETKNVRWMNAKDIFEIYKTKPEELFTLEVPAWEYYFKNLGWL